MGLINQQIGPVAEEQTQPAPADLGVAAPRVMEGEDLDQGPEPDESDPAYQQALEMMNDALYKRGAADGLAKQISHSPDPVEAIANSAYEIVSIIGERMQGALADELVVSLAFEVLTNVVEIAEAAGIKVNGQLVSKAVKMLLQRYAAETGMDDGTLQEALAQADDQQIGAALDSQPEEEPAQ